MFSDEVDWSVSRPDRPATALSSGLGDLLLDVLRARARIGRVHDRRRNLHGRHQRERQGRKAVKAEHNDHEIQKDGHYVVLDKGCCYFHRALTLPAVTGDDTDGRAVGQIGLTLGNDAVALVQAGGNLGLGLADKTGFNRDALCGRAALVDGEQVALVVVAGQHALGRNGERVLAAVGVEDDGRERADGRLGAVRNRDRYVIEVGLLVGRCRERDDARALDLVGQDGDLHARAVAGVQTRRTHPQRPMR